MAITFRRGTAADVEAIAVLHHAVWLETQAPLQPEAVRRTRDIDFFRSRVAVFATPPLVAIDDSGTIVGFSGWDNHYIGQMFLSPAWRGQGVGTRLLAETERLIAKSGSSHARLVVIAGNHEARQFYEGCGWSVVSEQPLQLDTFNGPVEVGAWHLSKTLVRPGQSGP